MYATYGSRKCGNMRVPISPCECAGIKPPEPNKISNDRFPRCRSCPYPRHGLFCWTDSETCLRTEMDEIYNRGRRLEVTLI